MNYFLRVHILKSQKDTGCEKSGLLLVEFMFSANVIPEVSCRHKIHNKIKSISILKSLTHIDDKFVLESLEELSFVANGFIALLCKNAE